jgi:hypothetical protein
MGVFVVKLWWVGGDLWSIGDCFCGVEKHAKFSNYIFNYFL